MPIKKQHFETWLDFYELIQWGEADIKIIFSFLFTIKSGVASKDDMNCHWVKLRSEIQGIQPPNLRSEVKILQIVVGFNVSFLLENIYSQLPIGVNLYRYIHIVSLMLGIFWCWSQISCGWKCWLCPLLHRICLRISILPNFVFDF